MSTSLENPREGGSRNIEKRPYVPGCTKYQALRYDDWQDTGLLNTMVSRPTTTVNNKRLKTDFISSFAERPMSVARNETRERLISRMLRQRQDFNANTETKEDWIEPY